MDGNIDKRLSALTELVDKLYIELLDIKKALPENLAELRISEDGSIEEVNRVNKELDQIEDY